MTETNWKFESTFKISTKCMWINFTHPNLIRNSTWLFIYVSLVTYSVICVGLLVYSIFIHDIKDGRFDDASKNIIMIIVSVTINVSSALVIYHKNSMIDLMEVLDKDYELAKSFIKEEKDIVNSCAKKGVKICKIWLLIVLATGSVFPLRPIILMIISYFKGEFKLVPMFEITLPPFLDIYKNNIIFYCVWFMICLFFDVYASFVYLGFEPLVPIFMLHSCGQLEILSSRVLKLFSEDKSNKEVEENIQQVAKKLQEIYGFIKTIENNFTVLYEYTMKTSTFLLPLSAFQVVESLRYNGISVEFLNFFIGTILLFYIPCYYSDLLMEKSEKLRQALYSCQWESHPNMRVRKYILFMLTRTTRPLVISTIFFPICLDTFAEMSRQAYAIFNFMNAAWS